MSGLDWGLELVLVGLLAIVLLHAIRLERAVTALRRDRSALGDAVAGFDVSAREAHAGLGKLRHMTATAADEVAHRVSAATALRDDLAYLTERGSQVADRLETLVRTGRTVVATKTEAARAVQGRAESARAAAPQAATQAATIQAAIRGRSAAERDLAGVLQDARAEKSARA